MMMKNATSGLVYSTDTGRMCPDCRQAVAVCACRKKQTVRSTDGVVRVSRETRRHGGKSVTLIKGLALDPMALALLGKQLRAVCGSGGTVKDGVIEVQGDHRELVVATLVNQGHQVKLAGG